MWHSDCTELCGPCGGGHCHAAGLGVTFVPDLDTAQVWEHLTGIVGTDRVAWSAVQKQVALDACLSVCHIWMDSPCGTLSLSSAVIWTVQATGTSNCAAGSNTLLDHLHCCTTCLCLIICEHVASTAVEFCCKLLVCWISYCVLAAEVIKFYPWMCWHVRFF
jgi:hypothetical protein